MVAHAVEGGAHDLGVAEDGADDPLLGVQVADPGQAVALDAVPHEVLHAQVHGVGADVPDAVEPLVAALEGAAARQVAIDEYRARRTQHERRLGREQIDADEAEAGGPELDVSVPGDEGLEVVDGVVLIGLAHGLADGLAEAEADARRRSLGRLGRVEAHAAVELAAEVEQHGGDGALPCRLHRAAGVAVAQQMLGLGDGAGRPHDVCRQHQASHARVEGAVIGRRPHGCLPLLAGLGAHGAGSSLR